MTDQQQEPTSEAERPRVLGAILRMDLQGSESVTREDDRAFTAFMAALRKQVELYPSRLGKLQAEGDSIRQAFTDLRVALRCAFYLRTAAQQPIVTTAGLRSLPPRIVLHFGALIKNEDYAEGAAQITPTRLDHAVPAGEILATEAFADVARHIQADKGYSFGYMGKLKLAKGSGQHPCYTVTLTNEATSSGGVGRPKDPVELVKGMFDRGDLSSQAGAVELLGRMESESASGQLLRIALDRSVERRVRQAALVRLQDRGEDIDVSDVKEAAEDETSPVETRALFLLVLGATGSKDAFSVLSNVLTTNPPEVSRLREAALLAMRGLKNSDTGKVVEGALKPSEEHDVRVAACVVAAASGVMSADVQKQLYDISSNPEEPLELRTIACEALASQRTMTSAMSQRLEELVQDREFPLTIRHYALDGLAQSDDPCAVQAVEEVARRTDDQLQVEAIEVLAAMPAPRPGAYRRPRQPASHLADVIHRRTRPQSGRT